MTYLKQTLLALGLNLNLTSYGTGTVHRQIFGELIRVAITK